MNNNQVEAQWAEFAQRQFGHLKPSQIQFEETKKTFYLAWAQCLLFAKHMLSDVTLDHGAKVLEDQLCECYNFIHGEMRRAHSANKH